MIGKLKGVIEEIGSEFIILDVGGVGYQVYCPENILNTRQVGEVCNLHIQTYVREDAIILFGFESHYQKDIFLLLRSVNGVGNKTALSILSKINLNELAAAISGGNQKLIASTPGIGNKTAERIILELKNHKIFAGVAYVHTDFDTSKMQDATFALIALGISKTQAASYVTQILAKNPDSKIDDIIRQALTFRGEK